MSEKVLMRKIKKREKTKLTKLQQRKEERGKSVATFEITSSIKRRLCENLLIFNYFRDVYIITILLFD